MKYVKSGSLLLVVTLSIFAYQNCSPAFVPMGEGSAALEASNVCSDSPLAGIWNSDPDVPSAGETLTIASNCVATSKICGSSISFTSIPAYGGTAIQGQTTIQVTGSNQGPTCLPDGTYQCTYGLGPSSKGDVFGATCEGGIDLVFYRQAPAAPTPTPTPPMPTKIVYYTTNRLLADFGGKTQADAFCMSDPGKPASVASAKALLASSDRRACSTPNCSSGAAEGLDWVLKPSTVYTRPSGVRIGVTNSGGVWTFNLENAIFGDSGAAFAWTGLNSNWTSAAENCGNWTTTSGMASIGHFQSTNKFSIGLDATVPGFYRECNSPEPRLICVEQ